MTTAHRATALVRRRVPGEIDGIELQTLAREAGMNPELARRLVRLGELERLDGGDPKAPAHYPVDAAATLARAVRLAHDLGLNYAGAVLACQLLSRIAELEVRLQAYGAEPR